MVMTLRRRAAPASASASVSSPAASGGEEEEEEEGSTSRKKKISSRVANNNARSRVSADSDDDCNEENSYEKSREQRIRENRERLEKLGILWLSSQFHRHSKSKSKSKFKPKPKSKPKPRVPSSYASFHCRVSPRIRPQRYSETETPTSLKGMGIAIPDAWKPELYTQEDERLLGNCEAEWALNVDGFGEDGERLYDPVSGTSCHQCRQKTIRKHTFCGRCRSSLGVLCGDCLYTRYGENVLEATLNSAWTCPACRGICNCSRCRRAKGWPPLNILYSKVVESGFKSVAHYLILTRRAGAMEIESEEVTSVHALPKAEDTQAPLRNQGSDISAEWSGSGDDDDDDDDSDDNDSDGDSSKTHKIEPECLETNEAAETN
ncbi:hypothetical protein vseg_018737 [Gypsophila vaccaria]